MHVGQIIKKFRKEKRMTLVELSQRSGVALATLSRMENGKMTGTLKSHMHICEALNIALTDLYKELPSSQKTLKVEQKSAGGKVSVHDKKSSSIMLASGVKNKKMMPLLITIVKGGHTHTEETSHGVEKFIYVLEGKIEANVGEEKYGLGAGDTIYFDSSVPHFLRNAGNGEAQLISVSCPAAG
ncbi:MAG: XRE family transcriptional regulator [Candidatus Omnitrophica bacterium]|nr:XRE family transcriptional regulator [Candidatus Omnitrophota bacterium]